jgi:hypothetical protein
LRTRAIDRFVDKYAGHLSETAYGWDSLEAVKADLKRDSTDQRIG